MGDYEAVEKFMEALELLKLSLENDFEAIKHVAKSLGFVAIPKEQINQLVPSKKRVRALQSLRASS